MKYYHAIYMNKKLLSRKTEILKKIDENKLQFEIYIIALTRNQNNHLEIFNSAMLIQKTVSKEHVFVVGIAFGYGQALELVEKITQEVYDNTKGADIRNYILTKQEAFEKGNV